ncbi:MAG: hypothetical protein KKA60_14575 [Proteobacteria bacterium]|nr:hypothetical protein [Pseudomonadota bacterium]
MEGVSILSILLIAAVAGGSYFLTGTLIWLARGCRVPLKKELSEDNSTRNSLTMLALWVLAFVGFIIVNN